MFDILFGWRKASKCKKLIKQVQCRLKLLKTKRHSIVRQLREDVAQLIDIGYEDIAFNRAEHLFKDETTVSVYELLENFCEFIMGNLSYIRRHKDCPNDINEAVSSLIFASARCGDLPELRAIRKLFGERYGQRFERTAIELLPGNLVNLQVREKLSIESVPDDAKQKLVEEISRDYCFKPEILALEYTSELHQQEKVDGGIAGYGKVESGNADDIEGKSIYADASSTFTSLIKPLDDHPQDEISTCISSSLVEQSSSDLMESPMNFSRELCGLSKSGAFPSSTKESQVTGRANLPTPDRNGAKKTTASSSESLPQFPEEMIIYLDDVEELQHSIAKEGSSQDQRIFKFKSTAVHKNRKAEDDSYNSKHMDPYESSNDCSSSGSSRKRVKAARKRSRRRSFSLENSNVQDIHCMIYYEKPCKVSTAPGSHLHYYHLCQNQVKCNKQSVHSEKRRTQPQSCHCFSPEAENCYTNSGSYFWNGDGRDFQEVPPSKQHKITPGLQQIHVHNTFHCCECSRINGESDTEMEWYAFPARPRRRSCELGDFRHNSFTDRYRKPDEQSKGNGFDSTGRHVACNVPSDKTSSHWTRNGAKPPYLRAMTMPQERSKDGERENVLQYSKSFPAESSNHVHPKLPDYDELAAKFMALKKEHLQNNKHN